MNVRFEENNGHDADVTRCLLMALSGPRAGCAIRTSSLSGMEDNARQSGPELAQSGERELNSHRQHDQPHETRDHVARRPALAGLGGS